MEATMNDGSKEPMSAGAADAAAMPPVIDRASFEAELDGLRAREKAHTHEGDAIAAARRRLPMVEVDPTTPLMGANGRVTLLETFEGRRQLIAYYHMWYPGRPAPEQCEGCTWVTSQVAELGYLHSRDITYAAFCQGPYDESIRYHDFMDYRMPWYSAQDSLDTLLVGRSTDYQFYLVCYLRRDDRVFETYWTRGRGAEVLDYNYALMDCTVYGRQEPWEDSPPGWPQGWKLDGAGAIRTNGPRSKAPAPRTSPGSRPIAQWSRLEAGRSDDLTVGR
jgi:predicted dithiol-disulfide oxidoreductase (DUF899 family)